MPACRIVSALLACSALSGCGMAWNKPANSYDMNGSHAYMAERRDMPDSPDAQAGDPDRANAARCSASLRPAPLRGAINDEQMPLSPGDVVQLSLPGNEAPSGTYKVDSAGALALDVLGTLRITGLSVAQAEAELSRRVVATGFFRAGHARATLRLLDRGAVRIRVSGAVFQPGRVVVNQKSANDRDPLRDSAAGDHAPGRALSNALASAAGVRPDADVEHVAVTRAGVRRVVNMAGMITGDEVDDILLADGDQVEVPSRHCFQAELARPSPITPPGVRAFISNLTVPAASNASAAVGREATTFPYGTRLLQALISGNCIGGIQSTNAGRWAVLISTNPATGRTEVVEREIERLVRRSDRDGYNPVILPGDGVACYDSVVTNIRDVVRTITEGATGPMSKL